MNHMKMATFTFDRITGRVWADGTMQWATFTCQKSAALGNLRKAVEKAFATL
jgi:hypothetical protein